MLPLIDTFVPAVYFVSVALMTLSSLIATLAPAVNLSCLPLSKSNMFSIKFIRSVLVKFLAIDSPDCQALAGKAPNPLVQPDNELVVFTAYFINSASLSFPITA